MKFELLSLQSAEKCWSRQDLFSSRGKARSDDTMTNWWFLFEKEGAEGWQAFYSDQQCQQYHHQYQRQQQQQQLISAGRDRGPDGKPFTGSQGARVPTPGIILWEGKTGGFQTSPTRVYACKCPSTWRRYLGWMFTTGNLISWDVTLVWQLETAD